MNQQHPPEGRPSRDNAFSHRVTQIFQELIGRFGEHAVAAGTEVYIQPYVYLSAHLVQMQAAGWVDVDFDQIAAVSGASALLAYQPGEFMPKYAHLHLDLDQRIADATGFGYEWIDFQGLEGAWGLLRQSVDADRPVKGWHWENILFSDYREAAQPKDRRVFAMADGPDTFAKWWGWDEFAQWVKLVEGWRQARLGRHTSRVPTRQAEDMALQVIRDLVECSTQPPQAVLNAFPEATFGLAGIEAYADDCERDPSADWLACHDINPQWAIRNTTGVYLRRVADSGLFGARVNTHLLAAAMQYRAAYESWQAFYTLLGHKAEEQVRKTRARRIAGAAVVRAWLDHERAALGEIEQALALLA
jgi:hypothetical protein